MSDPATTPISAESPRSVELTVLIFTAIIGATALAAALTGLVVGDATAPWITALNKAPGSPPPFVLGLIWPTLYALMAIGACLVWNAAGSWKRTDGALSLYFIQLVPNLAGTWLFFGLRQPLLALISTAILFIMVALMTREFHRHSRLAAVMQYPYLAWLVFALYLNAWVVFAN